MTIKTMSGTYVNGYTLAAQFSGAYVTKTGSVTGSAGSYPGGNAGAGFTLPTGDTLTNSGVIHGGAGGAGASALFTYTPGYTKNGNYYPPNLVLDRPAGPGGAGGVGVSASASVRITNTGTIIGGACGLGGIGGAPLGEGGGYYGEPSGAAGAGILLKAGGSVTNFGVVEGGYYGDGGYGGVGAVGITLASGGDVTNGSAGDTSALIEGGVDVFFNADGPATIRGVGVMVTGAGTVANFGTIEGGDYNNTPDGATGAAVEFTSPGGELIVYGGSTFLGAIYGDGGTLDFATGSGTISGAVTATGAVVETVGATSTTFSNFGTVALGSGSQFTVATTLTNYGSVAQSGIVTVTGGTITNELGATWNIANGLDPTGGAGSLYNAGLFTKTVGTGLVHVGVDFYNDFLGKGGTVDIALGALDFIGATNFFIGTVTGAGTLTLGGGSTTLEGVFTVDNLEVEGAATSVTVEQALSYAGVWTQLAGTVSVATGDKLTLTGGGDYLSGTLAGAGTVDFSGGSETLKTLTLSASHMSVAGAAVTLWGAIDLTGVLIVTTPDLIVTTAGATLEGGGTLELTNTATNAVQGASAAARLTNEDRIQGAGQLGDGQMSLLNEAAGSILGDDAQALVIDTGAGTLTNDGLIESAGTGGVAIAGAIDNAGTLTAAKGTLSVDGAVTGAGKVLIEGGTADFGSTFTQAVTFTAAGGELELAKSQTYTGTITGFSKTTTTSLDLKDIVFTTGTTKATYSGTTTSGTLTVTDGTHTAKIKLSGNYTASTFTVSSDGHGGTKVVDPIAAVQPHAFIAAMAGMVDRGGPVGATSQAWRPDQIALVAPR